MTPDDIRPPIPASCAHRPTTGGLVIPAVNLQLADGGADFRGRHQTVFERSWKKTLCQVCDRPTGHPAVLFGGPEQLAAGHFNEPPLCAACASYTSKACPMIAGRLARFASRQRISEGRRGKTCPDPGCDCGGWVTTDDAEAGHDGEPAWPWYAVFIDPAGYAVAVHHVDVPCTEPGCHRRGGTHRRTVVNGGLLTAPPRKVVQVSAPGEGRMWRRLPDAEAAALLPATYPPPTGDPA